MATPFESGDKSCHAFPLSQPPTNFILLEGEDVFKDFSCVGL